MATKLSTLLTGTRCRRVKSGSKRTALRSAQNLVDLGRQEQQGFNRPGCNLCATVIENPVERNEPFPDGERMMNFQIVCNTFRRRGEVEVIGKFAREIFLDGKRKNGKMINI